MQRSLRRIKHRIKRLVTSYMSPLGWAVTGLTIASLITFTILGWHELLAMAIVFACMMVAAILLSLGNTSFTATIDVSSRRVTVSDTVKSRHTHRQSRTHANHIRTRRPAYRRQPRTILHPHTRRRPITSNNRGIHRRLPRSAADRTAFHTQRRPIRTRTARKETRRPNQRVHPPSNRHAEHTQRRNSARPRRSAQRRNRRRRPRLLRTARIRAGRRRAQRALAL